LPTSAPATTTPPPAPALQPIIPSGFSVPGGKDYFGPPLSATFDAKSVFPDTPPSIKAAETPQKLPPPQPIVLSDGYVLEPLPPIPPPPKIWSGGFEVGLNGSQGNADVLNLRLGANTDRKTDDNRFHTDFNYSINRQNGVTEQNQAILNSRDELLF